MARVSLEILWDDDELLAVNKPAGVLTIPGRGGGGEPALREVIAELSGTSDPLRLVHRLDRETSGVLVLARTLRAQRALCGQFARRQVSKHYLALVQGRPPDDRGTILAPLAPHPRVTGRMIISERKGRPSETRWEVLERFRVASLLRCTPLTGRQHQIRVHLQSIGLPLLVDRLYGDAEAFHLSRVKPGYRPSAGHEERPLLQRLSLHAEALTLRHPATEEEIRLEAAPPKDFRATLHQLRRLG